MKMQRGTWASAVIGAVALGFLMTAIATGVIVVWAGVPISFWPALAGGGAVGLFTAGIMLWLFHQFEITATDIWRSIGDLWNEFGKSAF